MIFVRSRSGRAILQFLRRLHSGTARALNLRDVTPGRHIWFSYWDTCIRTEADYWIRFNYVHNNPVKHGYVRQADAWAFSSDHYYQRTHGAAWLADCWHRAPC